MVSHWEVNSNAAVKLITGAVGETARDQTVGRAEALRRAMLALIDKGEPHEAHPAYWAPFVVVGEGGASGATIGVPGTSATAPAVKAAIAKQVPTPLAQTQSAPTPLSAKSGSASTKKTTRPNAKVEDDWKTKVFGQ